MIRACKLRTIVSVLSVVFIALTLNAAAQQFYPLVLKSGTWHNQQRALRYKPDGEDIVITNGYRRFTRALYGTNTAFRVEAGDLPEFAMYMPGMGGNLKFGLIVGSNSKWLITAQKITARYRAGAMLYDIEDPMLGKGKLQLVVLAMGNAEGLILKARFTGVPGGVHLLWAFGGASGKKFSRDGDMGPDPESSFYLKPESSTDNRYELAANTFTLKYGTGEPVLSEAARYENALQGAVQPPAQKGTEKMLQGFVPPVSELKLGDANRQESPLQLYASQKSASPLIMGRLAVKSDEDLYFALQNPAGKVLPDYKNAPVLFNDAEAARKAIAGRVNVNTPDPYINTVGAALSIASDAIWESPSYMHGSVGWRMRLNGWRGPYTADPLGWHNRAREHFKSYALSQVTSPEYGPNTPDTALHLSRQVEKIGTAVFTSGYISREPGGRSIRAHHYDMNLVYIDALLWHLNWTGDLGFAKEMWPVLQRHLAWEKRNFDGDNDGLYDAYAAIWASDALQYSGGAVTHSSAYNYRANTKAVLIAKLIGEDPAPYQNEADKIHKALNTQLWMPVRGWYAKYKDLLGNKNLHPAAALWTIYHSLDSEVPDAFQAYQSLRYIDTEIPHIPITGKDVPAGSYTISTSNWMPYQWSLNNVALAESMHTALANWQGGRTEEAFRLWKSELISSMYMGGSAGNFVQISYYDAIRGEAYRDFGDPVGITSRTLVEGLFGIVPDALNHTLNIRPGLPSSWNYASLTIPDLSFNFKRQGSTDTYTLIPRFTKQLALKFRVKAPYAAVKAIWVNGKPAMWTNVSQAVAGPVLEINIPYASRYEIKIAWQGDRITRSKLQNVYAKGSALSIIFPKALVAKVYDPQKVFNAVKTGSNTLRANISGDIGNRTVFVQLKQGQFTWWYPLCFKVEHPVTLTSTNRQLPDSLSFKLQNNTNLPVQVTVKVNTYMVAVTMQASSSSRIIPVPAAHLIPGSNAVHIRSGSFSTDTALINWNINRAADSRNEPLDISSYFNDQVTTIFKNQYFSPRAPYPTLQLPTHGMGEWTHPLETAVIDDSGLRQLAGNNGQFTTPQGIVFKTPGEAGKANIVFTSKWDAYPDSASIPLTGRAAHAYFLMAGTTNPMQSRMENAAVMIVYTDGSSQRLALKNPQNWWPIEQDYFDDGYAFTTDAVRPVRLHLKTGLMVSNDAENKYNGKHINGGAATILDLPLNPLKTLKHLTVKALANDVVIGLLGVTLVR